MFAARVSHIERAIAACPLVFLQRRGWGAGSLVERGRGKGAIVAPLAPAAG